MGELINFSGKKRYRMWAVWKEGKEYKTLDISGKSKLEIIKILPTPTPNFVCESAATASEVIDNIKRQQLDALLD